jgi:secreted Zn-dependent insulinase-like peptidase
VIEATFQYVRRLKEVGPQKYVFDEINDLGKVSFDFESKSEALDTCEMISSRMQLFDNENMPELLRSREIR